MTTVLYINVQFVQPVCCCLVQGKKVTIALCVGEQLVTCSAVCLASPQLHAASSRRPIFCIVCSKRPWPVRSRFRRTQQCRRRSCPGGCLFGVLMYFCRWVELACHLVCHAIFCVKQRHNQHEVDSAPIYFASLSINNCVAKTA